MAYSKTQAQEKSWASVRNRTSWRYKHKYGEDVNVLTKKYSELEDKYHALEKKIR